MPVKRVTVELYHTEINGVLQDDVGKNVIDVTIRVLNRSKVLCPVRTGNLRASHQFRIRRSVRRIIGEVFTKVKYALPVHDGRRSVIIRPKEKKALAFVWHGQPMVRKWVYQPARPGRPWMRDALREVAAGQGYKMTSNAAVDQTETPQ